MKDFPVFATEYGVASLLLKEIPYKKTAYIQMRDTQDPEKLLEECISFCRICGAESVYAAGHDFLERYPMHTAILEMRGMPDSEEAPAQLFPVTEETVGEWIRIYNEKMRTVPNAATLEQRDKERILKSCGAYYVHDNGRLLGIGWVESQRLEAIAAVEKGMGETVLRTLQSIQSGQQLCLEVASANQKAMALYQRMGFLTVGEKNRWYCVFSEEMSRKNT